MKLLASIIVDILLRLFTKAGKFILYLFGWRFIWIVGRCAGGIVYSLRKKMREITKQELKLLFGQNFNEKRLQTITKRSFENYYMRQIETVFFGSLNSQTLDKIMHVEGLGNLDLALAEGKGVVLLLAHFGSFLLPLPFLGFKGYKINQITGKQIHTSVFAERLWEWRKSEAERLPVKFIQVDKLLRPVFKALRNNEILAIAFDGRDGSKYQPVKFLNRTALISPGPINIALRTNASIVPVFIVRHKDDMHRIIFCKPIKKKKDEPEEKYIAENVKGYADLFVDFVLRYPCHYGLILHKMRKDCENGMAKPFFIE